MTPLTPAVVMDEQRLQEIERDSSLCRLAVRRDIDTLIAEVRRLQEAEEEAAVLRDIQRSDYTCLLDAWRERGEPVPGSNKQSVVQRVVLGVHELREARDAALTERDALLVRVDHWRQTADREVTACVEMRAERDAARAERDDARAALQAVEWADMERRCPWCLAYADDNIGHKAYCQRQAALGMGRLPDRRSGRGDGRRRP